MMIGKNKMKIKENDEKFRKRTSFVEFDHWTILEEIEAPMWADLTLEPNMTAEENDDAWFHTSHPFHHLSARQLRSAFAHPDVGNDFVKFNLQGACSPKLPSSVSKSRGKDYIGKPRRNNDLISVSKNHPVNDLGNRIFRLDKIVSRDCKHKVSPENQSEATDSITSEICNGSGATAVSSNSLNPQSACISGASTTSTVTTVSQSQDIKLADVSKEVFGRTSGLLNALKTNLRRSRATRPALRVEICDDGEVKGQNSSSGKSSVRSSSFGHDGNVKGSTILKKTDHPQQVEKVAKANIKPRGQKSLTGKSSPEQVKKVTNVNMKPRNQKSMIGKSGLGFSIPTLEVKKTAASDKEFGDKNLDGKGPTNVEQPMNKRGTAYKASEGPVEKTAAGLKQKELGNSYVRDIGKLVQTIEGKVKAQKLVEASDKTRACYRSRLEGRGGVTASACSQTVKSKVLITENVTNRSRLGGPGVKGEVGRAHLNGSSCSTKENIKRVALSRISSGNCNMPVVRTSNQKRPAKLSENKGSVASVGSKVNKTGRVVSSKVSSDALVYHI